MAEYTINSAGMAVPKDARDDGPCWVCGQNQTLDGLCLDCCSDVLCLDRAEPLDRWDAEAAKRGLPPIDRAKWRAFYCDAYPVEAER